MKQLDPEYYILGIRDFLKANLNTAITAITTEKNDALSLPLVSDDAYFVESLNEKTANYDPFVLVGFDDIGGEGCGPATTLHLVISAVIICADRMVSKDNDAIGQIMLRYLRAFTDLFNSNFNKIFPHVKLKINSLKPIAVTTNSNDPFRVTGVSIIIDVDS